MKALLLMQGMTVVLAGEQAFYWLYFCIELVISMDRFKLLFGRVSVSLEHYGNKAYNLGLFLYPP